MEQAGMHRFKYIDRAKAVAMLCVVFCHVNLFDYYGFGENINICKINSIVTIFQLPLFIFLNGLVVTTKKRSTRDIATQIYKKFRTLIMPLIVVGGVYTYMCAGLMPWKIFTNSAFFGYWYLWCLFVFYIIHFVYEWLIPNKGVQTANIIFDLVWLVVWSVTLKVFMNIMPDADFLSYSYIANLYPYFFLGILLKKYGVTERLLAHDFILSTSMILTVLFIASISNNYTYPLSHPSFCVGVIALIVGFLLLHENKSNKLLTFLDWVGQNTLDVYIFHYFIISSFQNLWIGDWFINGHYSIFGELFLTGIPSILFTIISIYIGKFVRSSIFLSKTIFFK